MTESETNTSLSRRFWNSGLYRNGSPGRNEHWIMLGENPTPMEITDVDERGISIKCTATDRQVSYDNSSCCFRADYDSNAANIGSYKIQLVPAPGGLPGQYLMRNAQPSRYEGMWLSSQGDAGKEYVYLDARSEKASVYQIGLQPPTRAATSLSILQCGQQILIGDTTLR